MLPALVQSVGSYPFVEGLFMAGAAFHRHADLPPARITPHDVALDGHGYEVYSDGRRCQVFRDGAVVLPIPAEPNSCLGLGRFEFPTS